MAQYVYSLSAEHCFRLRNNAISDERVRDCALSTHSVLRPVDNKDIRGESASTSALKAKKDSRVLKNLKGHKPQEKAASKWSAVLGAFRR